MKKLFFYMLVCFAVPFLTAQDRTDMFRYESGDMVIYLLSEGQQQGNTSILLNTTPAMLAEYVPDGTFPNATNAFLIKTEDQNILVDTGHGKKLFGHLESLGLKPEDIHVILITHMHGDHIGGLLTENNKRTFPNADVYVSVPEYTYWSDKEIMEAMPERSQNSFKNAQKVFKAYRGKVHLFSPGTLARPSRVMKDIVSIGAYGHTPGHTMYLFNTGLDKILVWGDLTHAMAIQMPYPQVAVTYDVNPEQAVQTRIDVLKFASENDFIIAGMHIAYPALGEIKMTRPGSYRFIPANSEEWDRD